MSKRIPAENPAVITVVEDNIPRQTEIISILKKAGFKTQPYKSAAEALESFDNQKHPQLIITGLMMTRINGRQFCRILKSAEYTTFNRIPIIILSEKLSRNEAFRIKRTTGADDVLSYPVNGKILIKHINSLLNAEKIGREIRTLIIENDKELAATIKKEFKSHGYTLRATESAEDALEKHENHPFDLVILDIDSSKAKRDILLNKFRSISDESLTIVLTSHLNKKTAIDFLKKGVDGYLQKPFSTEALFRLCEDLYEEKYRAGIDGKVHNISEYKKTEETLKEKTEQLRTLNERFEFILEATKTDVDIISEDFNLGYVDKRWRKKYGNPDGRKCYEYFMGRKTPCPTCGIPKALETKRVVVSEETLPLENNRVIQVHTIPFKDTDGKWKVAEFNIDITDIKKTEAALRESETKFRTLVENSPMGIFLLNNKYQFTYANEEIYNITGYTTKETIGSDFRKFLAPQSLSLVSERYKKRQKGKEVPIHYDFKIVRKNGEQRDVELIVASIKDQAGEPKTLGQIFDITEKKRIDNALIEREESLRSFIDNSLMGVLIIDEDGRIIEWNKSIEALSGILKNEAIGQYASDIILQLYPPENRTAKSKKQLMNSIKQGLKTGVPITDTVSELVITNKNGKKITTQQLIFPIKTNRGYRFGIMLQDITDRKNAEDALRESETKFRTLVEHSPAGIFLVKDDYRFFYANNEMSKILGFKREEIIGMDFRNVLTPQSLKLVTDRYLRRQRGEKIPDHYDFQIIKKNGEVGDVTMVSTVIQDQTGKPLTIAQIFDITERKRIEKTLIEREESLRSFIDHSIIGVMIINEEGQIIEWNKALEKLSGIPKKEAFNQNWWNLLLTMIPENTNIRSLKYQIIKSILQSLKSGKPAPNKISEWEIVNRSGNRIIAEQLIFPIRTHEGYRFGIFTQDITDRKISEEALRESEERLLLSKNSSQTGMWDYNIEDNRLMWDEQMHEIYGIKPNEFDGEYLSWEAAVHPDDLEKAREEVQAALHNNQDFHSEFRIIKPDGSVRTIEAHAIIKRSPIGAPLHMIGANRDVTERIMVEAERLELERKFLHSQKLESLGVLAGGIAHDFNNLLTAIVGNLDLALMNIPLESSSSENIKKAIQATRRATDLTQQMLAYSGKGSFILNSININELVTDNVNLFRASIAKNVMLKFDKTADLPLIKADPGQVQQVVMNLLTNASEAIGASNGAVTLKTGTMECTDEYLSQSRLDEKPSAGKFVFFEVSDTGKGMNKETSHRLFDPFFTTKFAGRGLGLSAVLGIVRGHKGAIIIQSEIDKGTTFRVLFPVGKTGEAPIEKQYPVTAPEQISSTIKGTVLVVDDEEAVRRTSMEFLSYLGLKTLEAPDGEAACEIFREKKDEIDCVILDLTMPKMDGLMTYNEMKLLRPKLKVILCSGYSEKEATSRFNGHGLSAFLQKPYRLQELKNILVHILS